MGVVDCLVVMVFTYYIQFIYKRPSIIGPNDDQYRGKVIVDLSLIFLNFTKGL